MSDILERKEKLSQEIKDKLFDFYEMIKKAEKEKPEMILLHQDSFACDYQEEEYRLLGMAIKFAGLHKVNIGIIGGNRESIYTIVHNKS